ncbi:MAG: hypothetical protein ACTMH8_11395, partial [Brevibacterium aurantiacum]
MITGRRWCASTASPKGGTSLDVVQGRSVAATPQVALRGREEERGAVESAAVALDDPNDNGESARLGWGASS